MGKYAQALGVIEIPIKTVTFSIKPEHGDNLRFSEIRKLLAKDPARFDKEFVAFFTQLVARNEGYTKGSTDYEELELFVEFNLEAIVTQCHLKFGWTTEEEMQRQREIQEKSFTKLMMKSLE